jgi:hypothetical protein
LRYSIFYNARPFFSQKTKGGISHKGLATVPDEFDATLDEQIMV